MGIAGNISQAGAPHCAGSSWEPGGSLIKQFIIKAAVILVACFYFCRGDRQVAIPQGLLWWTA